MTGRNSLRLVGLMALLLAAGCDEIGENGSDAGIPADGSAGVDAAPLPPGVVSFHAAGATAEASFESGGEQFLVVPYSVSNAAAEAIGLTIKIDAPGGAGTKGLRLRRSRRVPLSERNPALWARWKRRLTVERWTRAVAERAASMRLERVDFTDFDQLLANGECTQSADCAAGKVCYQTSCESTVTIKVGAFAAAATIQADVKRRGSSVAILVESGTTVADGDLDALLDTFDKTIEPRDVALFGDPPLTAEGSQRSSDRNGDGLVWLVLTSKVAEKDDAVGFFVATDFVAVGEEPTSNEADILYSVPPGGSTTAKEIYRIMAHEFQHLLGFASKVYRAKQNGGQGALEALWLDEGQSHFAEDACGFGGENVTLLDQELFPSFGDTSMIPGVDDFGKPIDTLAMRAMAMTFVRYLFEQKGGVSYGGNGAVQDQGGAAWLKALHTTEAQGTAAVDETYGEFKAAFDRWIATVALDARGVTDASALNFQSLVDDPLTGNKIGLKMRGSRTDFTGTVVDLMGPIEDTIAPGDTSETVRNASGKFFLVERQSGVVNVTVTSQDSDVRFALIKLK